MCTALSLTTAPLAPSNVMVTRVSGTTVRVSWQSLSLVEAKGHITYRVMVTPTTGSKRRRQATQEERVCTLLSPCEVPANESSVIVVGLDRDTSYSVTVMAVNSEDEAGPTSVPITATIPGRVKQFFLEYILYVSDYSGASLFQIPFGHYLKRNKGPHFKGEIHNERSYVRDMCRCCEWRMCVLI